MSSSGVASDPTHAHAETLKHDGNEFFRRGQYDDAIAAYTAALRLSPENAALYCSRSAAYLKLSLEDEALADAEDAIRYRPNWAKAHFRLGEACEALNLLDDARGAYTQALQLEPEDETWKTALYKLLDKHAEQHSKRSMVLDEIRGSGYGAADDGIPEITITHTDLGTSHDALRSYADQTADSTNVHLVMSATPTVAGSTISPRGRKNLRLTAERRKRRAEELVEEASRGQLNSQLRRANELVDLEEQAMIANEQCRDYVEHEIYEAKQQMAEAVGRSWQKRTDAEMDLRLRAESQVQELNKELQRKQEEIQKMVKDSAGFSQWQQEQKAKPGKQRRNSVEKDIDYYKGMVEKMEEQHTLAVHPQASNGAANLASRKRLTKVQVVGHTILGLGGGLPTGTRFRSSAKLVRTAVPGMRQVATMTAISHQTEGNFQDFVWLLVIATAFIQGASDFGASMSPLVVLTAVYNNGAVPFEERGCTGQSDDYVVDGYTDSCGMACRPQDAFDLDMSSSAYWCGAIFLLVGALVLGHRTLNSVAYTLTTSHSPLDAFAVYTASITVWLFATYLGWPLSITHCQVAAMIGTSGSLRNVNWPKVGQIVLGFLCTSAASGLVAAGLFSMSTALMTPRAWPTDKC